VSRVKSVALWYSGPERHRRFGYTALAIGVLVSLGTAVRASVSDHPSLGTSVALALAAAAFQIWGAVAFKGDGREGRAQDTLVKSTTGRLLRMGVRSAEISQLAQEAFESSAAVGKQDLRVTLGLVSARLDSITDGAFDALDDWQFHPAAVQHDQDMASRLRPDLIARPPRGADDDDEA